MRFSLKSWVIKGVNQTFAQNGILEKKRNTASWFDKLPTVSVGRLVQGRVELRLFPYLCRLIFKYIDHGPAQ
jgi:hypothetical protein